MSNGPIDTEATGEVRLVTGSIPVVNAASPPTGQQQAIKVVGKKSRRFSLAMFVVAVVAALVSFVAVGQLRGPDRFRQQLGTESEGDLARILASLSSESSALQEELGSLKVDLTNLRNSSQNQGQASAEASAQLNALEVLAGTVPVKGPGLQITIDDPGTQVTYEVLVDAVQELRDAGAEALSINGRRVGTASAFGQKDRQVQLDGVGLSLPYSLNAIGPAATMEGGLKIPGGTLDTLRALNGVNVDVHRSNEIDMPALEHAPTFRTARPIGSKS